jgi:hypothetical protein
MELTPYLDDVERVPPAAKPAPEQAQQPAPFEAPMPPPPVPSSPQQAPLSSAWVTPTPTAVESPAAVARALPSIQRPTSVDETAYVNPALVVEDPLPFAAGAPAFSRDGLQARVHGRGDVGDALLHWIAST